MMMRADISSLANDAKHAKVLRAWRACAGAEPHAQGAQPWARPHGYGTIGSSGAHMGMYVAPKTTISASSVEEKVVTNDWGFRSGRNEPVVHWRDPLR